MHGEEKLTTVMMKVNGELIGLKQRTERSKITHVPLVVHTPEL